MPACSVPPHTVIVSCTKNLKCVLRGGVLRGRGHGGVPRHAPATCRSKNENALPHACVAMHASHPAAPSCVGSSSLQWTWVVFTDAGRSPIMETCPTHWACCLLRAGAQTCTSWAGNVFVRPRSQCVLETLCICDTHRSSVGEHRALRRHVGVMAFFGCGALSDGHARAELQTGARTTHPQHRPTTNHAANMPTIVDDGDAHRPPALTARGNGKGLTFWCFRSAAGAVRNACSGCYAVRSNHSRNGPERFS